ncbi:MAG: hypothetical protein RML94_00135 [Bacteroidia bacterium]|nr:hypothetical protein [Bacteroidia bacterium]
MITTLELHQMFDFRMDKEHTQDAPSIHPLTKDKFINLAIDTFVKTRYLKTDLTEKNRQDISPFLIQNTFTPQILSPTLLSYDLATLTPPHWYTIKMMIPQHLNCQSPYIEIVPEKHDNVFHRLNNPFKKPKPNKCFYTLQKEKTIQIYKHPDTHIPSIQIWYIKQYTPANILTNAVTDVTPQILQDIIAIATQYAIEHILSQRIQTFPPLHPTAHPTP